MAQDVRSVHVISFHPTFSVLVFQPPSLLFPDGYPPVHFPSSPLSSSSVTRPTSAGQAQLRTSVAEFGPSGQSTPLTFSFRLALTFAFVVTTVGAVVRSSAWRSAVFRPMSRYATIETRVCIHVTTIALRLLTLSFALALSLSERVYLHPVVVVRILRVFSRGSKIACGITTLQQRVAKRCSVCIRTRCRWFLR